MPALQSDFFAECAEAAAACMLVRGLKKSQPAWNLCLR
jgi:hypothetical protein